jgi:biopolymer transport protein ExbD
MDRYTGHKHHNPHAHVIHQPGRRLMHHIRLKFVWNKVTGHGGRSPNASLNLVSFIDFLVVTVVFLLMSFSASGEVAVDKNVKLPKAENVEDIIDAPMVAVNGNQILVDGVQAGSTRAIELDGGGGNKVVRFPDLAKKIEEEWKQQGGHRDPSDKKFDQCILHSDNRTPFREIIAVLDALYSPKRDVKLANETKKLPVFNMTFSVR